MIRSLHDATHVRGDASRSLAAVCNDRFVRQSDLRARHPANRASPARTFQAVIPLLFEELFERVGSDSVCVLCIRHLGELGDRALARVPVAFVPNPAWLGRRGSRFRGSSDS